MNVWTIQSTNRKRTSFHHHRSLNSSATNNIISFLHFNLFIFIHSRRQCHCHIGNLYFRIIIIITTAPPPPSHPRKNQINNPTLSSSIFSVWSVLNRKSKAKAKQRESERAHSVERDGKTKIKDTTMMVSLSAPAAKDAFNRREIFRWEHKLPPMAFECLVTIPSRIHQWKVFAQRYVCKPNHPLAHAAMANEVNEKRKKNYCSIKRRSGKTKCVSSLVSTAVRRTDPRYSDSDTHPKPNIYASRVAQPNVPYDNLSIRERHNAHKPANVVYIDLFLINATLASRTPTDRERKRTKIFLSTISRRWLPRTNKKNNKFSPNKSIVDTKRWAHVV